LRNQTIGDKNSERNLQPFRFGEWCGCHNGIVYGHEDSKLFGPVRADMLGNTDSEAFLLYLVSMIKMHQDQPLLRVLSKTIREIKAMHSWLSLTFVLTDGEIAITYVDFNRARAFEYLGKSLPDYFTLYRSFGPGYIAVCSEVLGNPAGWDKLPCGFLSLFDLARLEVVRSQEV